jgi:hypothetical protein
MILKLLSIAALLFSGIGNVFCQQPSMVYLINRHGVREARDTSTHEGGALLLQTAYDRLYTKGQHIRQQYPILSSTYKTDEIRVNSSSWERTITTAHGILAGLYSTNDTRSIPVYSTPWEYDYTLYNYDKCPNYDSSWSSFQQTPEWGQQVQKYSNLTSYMNTLLNPKTPITLSNVFSTWDLYWIQRNRPEITINTPAIDDYTYNVLTEAANWVETMRYGSRISGEYLGSTLRAAIRYRMDMFVKGDKTFGHKMVMSSAHYATQLNFLAALGYTGIVSKSIPDYNSVIAVELYNKTANVNFPSGWSIKMRYWDGTVSNSIPIALGNCVEGQDCEIDYTKFWSTYTPRNLQWWCNSCGSTLFMCKGANPDVTYPNTTNILTTEYSSSTNGVQIATLIFVILSTVLLITHFLRSILMANIVPCSSQQAHEKIPNV